MMTVSPWTSMTHTMDVVHRVNEGEEEAEEVEEEEEAVAGSNLHGETPTQKEVRPKLSDKPTSQ